MENNEYDFYKEAKTPEQRDYRYSRHSRNNKNALSREEFDKDYDDTINKSNAIGNKFKKMYEDNGNQRIKVKPSEYQAYENEWDKPYDDFSKKYKNGWDKYVGPSRENHIYASKYFESVDPEEYSDDWFDEYSKGFMRGEPYNDGYDWVMPYNSDDKYSYDELKENVKYIQPIAQLYNKVKSQNGWTNEDIENWNNLNNKYNEYVINPHWKKRDERISPFFDLYNKITNDDNYFELYDKNNQYNPHPYTNAMREKDDWNETKHLLGMDDYDDDEVYEELYNLDDDTRTKLLLAKQGFYGED